MANILLVEPDDARREFVWMSLEQAGYTVIAAADAQEGGILLEVGEWDALLTAADAGGGTGLQLARKAGARGIRTVFLDPAVTTLAAYSARSDPQQSGWLADLQARAKELATRSVHFQERTPVPAVMARAESRPGLRQGRPPRC